MPSPIGNFFVKTLLYSPLHPLMGKNIAVITVTGCKTGKSITTPVNTIFLEDALMVASLRNRTWWRNLRRGCDATLHQAGRTFMAHAEVIEQPDQVAAWLGKYFTQYPAHAKYFGIQPDPKGRLLSQDLERLAAERVIIRLYPAKFGL